MNNRKGKAKFKKFRILLESGCISTVVMGRLIEKLHPKKDAPIKWNTQARNITTNIKVNIDFTLPTLSTKNVVTWKCHADDSAKGGYDIILVGDLLTELGLNLKLYEHVIEADDITFNGSATPMADLGT